MLKVENVEVLGWEHAIRGMRNPKNSWAKSDSGPECPYGKEKCCGECQQNFCIGSNDKQLMMALRNAGTDEELDHLPPVFLVFGFEVFLTTNIQTSDSLVEMLHRSTRINDCRIYFFFSTIGK